MHYYKNWREMRAACPLGQAQIGPLLNIRGERFSFATLEDPNDFRAGRKILLSECRPTIAREPFSRRIKASEAWSTSPGKVE